MTFESKYAFTFMVLFNILKKRQQMELSYTYWEATEGGYIGYLNQYPDYWTQGDSIPELEKMLGSLYGDIKQFDDIRPAVPERTGLIAVAL